MDESNFPTDCGRERSQYVSSPLFGQVSLDFLYRGDANDCPYLSGRMAREEVFAAREFPPELYHDFMDHGFRRSGQYFYRPACDSCHECRPIRTIVQEYKPKKSHRRILNKNRDVTVRIDTPMLTAAKQRMYADYLAEQHNTFLNNSATDLYRFLYSSPVNTLEFEYRLLDRVVAVGIVDMCTRSLSSVYAYYDPEFFARSLGTFSAIREIAFCKAKRIPHYYMGYFVAQCPAMSYKTRFRPYEIMDKSFRWKRSATETL